MPFCANCGHEISDKATACPECGHPTGARAAGSGAAAAAIPTYLLQSILVTIFCCLPLGIVSIIYSTQVNSKLAAGDVAGAQAASGNAKRWALIALVAGLIANTIFIASRRMGGGF
jgi:hypothetical protein